MLTGFFFVQPQPTTSYHREALRAVCFHPTYPLFASCSDDATVHVFHGMVYNDLLQNPLIVPVKVRRTWGRRGVKGVYGVYERL